MTKWGAGGTGFSWETPSNAKGCRGSILPPLHSAQSYKRGTGLAALGTKQSSPCGPVRRHGGLCGSGAGGCATRRQQNPGNEHLTVPGVGFVSS